MSRPFPCRLIPRCGFTLLELLIALAVISLLLGLTLPALSQARASGRLALCLSNLRQLAAASAAYSVDDASQQLLPVHPTADVNPLYDDGFFDYGGATGSADVWEGRRVGPHSDRAAETRPLNAVLGGQSSPDDFALFRCPDDTLFDPAFDYPSWLVWDGAFRRMSAFEAVGTSFWGNACKGRLKPNEPESEEAVFSFSVFLRPGSRVPATSDTVLFMEMPALFNLAYLFSEDQIRFRSLGVPGWHRDAPVFNFAFCDGRAASVPLPEGWHDAVPTISDDQSAPQRRIRRSGIRFDCYPDPPILDLPLAKDSGDSQSS